MKPLHATASHFYGIGITNKSCIHGLSHDFCYTFVAMKDHWEHIYAKKSDQEVSWYQDNPATSLRLADRYGFKEQPVIDIGGGNSRLTELLTANGFLQLTVLDISSGAIERSKARLGEQACQVRWVESDILNFKSDTSYALWHDRATFHFLTNPLDIGQYVNLAAHAIATGGYLILATFSTSGPPKCSGLPITQYDRETLRQLFAGAFELVESFEEVHQTPFQTTQNFVWVVLQRTQS